MKKLLYTFVSLSVLFIACRENSLSDAIVKPTTPSATLVFENKTIQDIGDLQPISKDKLDTRILEIMKDKNDFRWSWQDDYFFWSGVKAVEPIVAIGYKPADEGDISDYIHNINIAEPRWRNVRDELLKFVENELNAKGQKVNIKDLIYEDDVKLPRIVLRIDDYTLLAKLRSCKNIRYIEPLDFDFKEDSGRSSSGCDGSAVTALPTGDYTTLTTTSPASNVIVPWNYTTMNIPNAWNLASTANQLNGKNITIGLIDAGLSSSQPMLNASFASGASFSGRSRSVNYTLGTSGYTTCTHGTSMCGLAAGPRNNAGATVGVAYNANLAFYRAANDVVLDGADEQTGVKNAMVALGDNSAVRVISMSMGTPFYSGTLEDGVNYAYGKQKLIFCAAGTSLWWTSWWGVIYPAKFDKCVAMTGVKENDNTCTVCHDGSEVDFTIVMERNANADRSSLSYHATGNLPSYVGGSSTATAMGAGIAAMVWSAKPTLSRDAVLNILKANAQYTTPTGNKGYGRMKPLQAVQAALNSI
jgi:serine protease